MGCVPDNYRGCTGGCLVFENFKLKKVMNESILDMFLGYHFEALFINNLIKKTDLKNL